MILLDFGAKHRQKKSRKPRERNSASCSYLDKGKINEKKVQIYLDMHAIFPKNTGNNSRCVDVGNLWQMEILVCAVFLWEVKVCTAYAMPGTFHLCLICLSVCFLLLCRFFSMCLWFFFSPNRSVEWHVSVRWLCVILIIYY